MSTLIPVSGETSEIVPPKSEGEIAKLLGAPGTYKHLAPDGSTWWVAQPFEIPENERATRFYRARGGNNGLVLRGAVLYLSLDETRILSGVPSKDDYVPVRGRTYDVREKLKAIGARWYAEEKTWKVPKSVLAEAEDIVRKGP